MILCYIDESGTPQIPGNTSHFVLCGLTIPIEEWKKLEGKIASLKDKYWIRNKEIHTAWLIRPYPQQLKIKNFEKLSRKTRSSGVRSLRIKDLNHLQKNGKTKPYQQAKKNYRKTEDYVHLTFEE
jgi:Protein of unknown function (DUF3800)